jgi:hypothetical protein
MGSIWCGWIIERRAVRLADSPGMGITEPMRSVVGFYINCPVNRYKSHEMTFLLPRNSTRLPRASFLTIAAAALGLTALCASSEKVQAQTNVPPAVAPAPRLTLTAEQEYIIREIVLKDINVKKETSGPETIGDVVPDDVKLYPFPPEVIQKVPQARSHSFFLKDDEIILVSPSDRRIADIIKKKSTD